MFIDEISTKNDWFVQHFYNFKRMLSLSAQNDNGQIVNACNSKLISSSAKTNVGARSNDFARPFVH